MSHFQADQNSDFPDSQTSPDFSYYQIRRIPYFPYFSKKDSSNPEPHIPIIPDSHIPDFNILNFQDVSTVQDFVGFQDFRGVRWDLTALARGRPDGPASQIVDS